AGNYTLDNNGYKMEIYTNDGTDLVKDITNNEGGDENVFKEMDNSFLIKTGLSFKAGDKAKIYLDTRFGIANDYNAYNEGQNDFSDRTRARTITLPTPILAAEALLGKRMKIQLSAVPAWSRTISGPVKDDAGEGGAAPETETVTDAYGITPNVGLSFLWGPLTLDTILSASFFNTYVNNPLALPASIFNSSTSPQPLFLGFDLKVKF
ncbi:MAG TPA: hypothetical protein VKS21_11365, partial [Spirochaetota bacterium]|nr:hypothetical protein [Spirochaetota bacterium]